MSEEAGVARSVSSKRGTQREYEATLILRPETNKAGIADLVGKLQGILGNEGSRLQKIDNWGVRTLAYPIQRSKKGIYLYTRFLGGSNVVNELERNLRIDETVLRYLTVLVDEDVDPEARPSDITDELLDAASESARDPLDILAEQQAKAREEAAAAAAAAAAEAAAEAAAAAAAAAENAERDEEGGNAEKDGEE
jgi:small subunit ribosomal protein S6